MTDAEDMSNLASSSLSSSNSSSSSGDSSSSSDSTSRSRAFGSTSSCSLSLYKQIGSFISSTLNCVEGANSRASLRSDWKKFSLTPSSSISDGGSSYSGNSLVFTLQAAHQSLNLRDE
ncbi:hypothetical protein Taro_024727 [Colocasia esculenta]|uniref:Uncharacterized protein n=1 Tax=Colocasia esculenta TaxID=4460 RepID=A0A843V892_COLES|nr:hypothetical protein [Colocasia esculenta]